VATTSASISLYERTAALGIIEDLLMESEGELTPEIAELLELAHTDFNEKAERVALKIRDMLYTADAVKEEEARLCARRKTLERSAESLKRYLQLQMERAGKEKVHGVLATVSLQKNPPALKGEVDADTLRTLETVNPDFVRVVPETRALDRKAVLDAWKRGEGIPVGLVVEQTLSLRIR